MIRLKNMGNFYSRGNFSLIASLLFFLISLATLTRPSFTQEIFNSIFINADTLFYPTFLRGLLMGGSGLVDWYFPHAFLFFPEFLIFIMCYLVFKNALMAVFLEGIITYLVASVSFVALYLYTQKWTKTRLGVFLFLLGSFNLLLGCKAMLPFYTFFVSPHYHVGTFFNSVLMYILIDFLFKNDRKKKYTLGVCLCFVLTVFFVFSDPLFLFYFVAPFTLAYYFVNRKSLIGERKIAPLLFLTLGSVTGLYLYSFFTMSPNYYRLHNIFTDLSYYLGSKYFFIGSSDNIFPSINYFPYVFFSLLGGMVVCSIETIKYEKRERKYLLGYYSIFLIIFSVLLYSILDGSSFRMLRFIAPAFLMIWLHLMSYLSQVVKGRYFLAATYTISIGLLLFRLLSVNASIAKYFPVLEDCLLKNKEIYNLNRGMAQYWVANKANYILDNKMLIYSVDVISAKICLKNTLGKKYDFIETKEVNFFVTNRLIPREEAIEYYGVPINSFKCGYNYVLIYEKNHMYNQSLECMNL